MSKKDFDVIIIGGGVAGLSAALWCDELGLDAILLESDSELGGQLLWTYNAIENHLGVKAENGQEMRDIFVKQINNRKFELKLNSDVQDVDLENKTVSLKDGKQFQANSIIIATGIIRRKLNVEGEEEFQGKGIIKSGKKDGKLVKGKTVAIIGGGDAAFENCQILSEYASKIFLIHRSSKFKARSEFITPAQNDSKVEILTDTIIKKIVGTTSVQALELENKITQENYTLPIDFLLLRIGVEPNTSLFKNNIDLDERGYIKINARCETSVQNVYSIGDLANPTSPTISSAIGMGTTAVKTILSQ